MPKTYRRNREKIYGNRDPIPIDSYSNTSDDKQAKDDGYLPCNYSPRGDNYNKSLVREQDFIEKHQRKKADGSRGPATIVIKRPGEAFYDSANQYWAFRTIDLVDGARVEGEWYKINFENIDFS